MSQTLFNANQLGPNTAIVRQDFTATAAQTNFVTTGAAFSGGILLVYVGGALLKLTDDYTISGSYTVVLNTPVSAGVLVTTILMTPISSFIPPFTAVPTRQVLTSGSGTYNTPSGARQLRVRFVAGGGGGAGATAGLGGTGGTTSFNGVTAIGGSGGNFYSNDVGGIGGTGGTGSASMRAAGSPGLGSVTRMAGSGGSSMLGAGARGALSNGGNNIGPSALANSGGGGGGGVNSSIQPGGGGGGGEYVELIINNPSPTYSYSVGDAGAAGVDTPNGGAGGSGIIIVDEVY